MRNLITFLSDFGDRDGYVASVKGKILSINAEARVVDISHVITPFQIGEAAYVISSYYRQFPPGTVHLAVVDPGVGTARKSLILSTKKYKFVGPDNGIFSYIQKMEKLETFMIQPIADVASYTFHARDIFGPVAALLASGKDPGELGVKIDTISTLQDTWIVDGHEIKAVVVSVDHFGTIITGFTVLDLEKMKDCMIEHIKIGCHQAIPMKRTYGEVAQGSALALWGGSGHLEIAVNQGNAAHRFNCRVGVTKVSIFIKKRSDDKKN